MLNIISPWNIQVEMLSVQLDIWNLENKSWLEI